MSSDDREFRIRPGRPRSTPAPRSGSFVNQVLRAARKAGPVRAASSKAAGAVRTGPSTFGRGRASFGRSRLFSPQRRVVVKARVVRHKGRSFRSAPMTAHLAYLKREGVRRDDSDGLMFDARTDDADDPGFAERCRDDRHHFRFIVSPEDARDMTDLRAFTRDLVKQMQADLGTKLDWIAADHWNTDNPHVHLLVRGKDEAGKDLVISRDYISYGLRSRAEDLVALELGPRQEHEIRSALEREVTAERWTRLDAGIRRQADEMGFIDLRPDAPIPGEPTGRNPESRRLMIGRLQHLEKMGLATSAGPGEWMLGLEAERTLRDLGRQDDIVSRMHRAFAGRGEERGVLDFVTDSGRDGAPVIGRLVDNGLHDELTGEAYAVIDGIDGRAHHIRLRGIEAFDQAPPLGGIVELRRFGGPEDPNPTLRLANRSDLDLQAQITAPGATWLDHRLVERRPMPLAMGGFGREVHKAMDARAEHLVGEGLARREGQRILLRRNLLATLRRRELDAVGADLAARTGRQYVQARPGDHVVGICGRRMALSSGRFAVIDDGLSFQLVPWSRDLEGRVGRHVSGVAKPGGSIDWSLGRRRDLGL
ncbi:DUF3363 domain-containing protein [Paracoccus sp. APAP_BH8]|uniref:relaxase/mobilization nuclease domain-containing protein n=1 Tax=Paracoccus sp. APAP_BH8 TaxID=3110237 RepID=UPI002FD80DEA